jgi:Rrf2 family protein
MHKLINISEASSIAIHSLALIAKLDKHINATHIAKLTGFSKNHLSKVLQILVKQGYLNSNRGPKGGFNLIKNADEISLLEIYELIEGKSANDFCTEHNPICPFLDCIYGDIVEEISIIFLKKFKERTIADIKWKTGTTYDSMIGMLN